MVREIEFEFRDDGAGGGEFLACGNVLGTLRDCINRGDVEAAARLFASCTEGIGDELLADLQAGSSRAAVRAAAAMFLQARDFRRAACCSEQAGDLEQAARCFEADYDLGRAAALYLQAQQLPKAAEVLEKAQKYAQAGDIYYRLQNLLKAAECWERAGSRLNAGKLYLKLQRWDRGVEVLQQVEPGSNSYPAATLLLGQVYERSGKLELAAQRYVAALTGRTVDAGTVELCYRLALVYRKCGQVAAASSLLARIQAFDPAFRDVAALLATQSTPAPAPAALDLSSAPQPERVVGIDREFELFKRLPLFAELSLEELRRIYTEVERTSFCAGTPLIVQGSPGAALFILIKGRARISTRGRGPEAVLLAEVGPGAHVGEMSLVDDAPTSADVIALDDVMAFRLGRDRFRHLLATEDRIALRFFRTFVTHLTDRLRETNRKLQASVAAPAG